MIRQAVFPRARHPWHARVWGTTVAVVRGGSIWGDCVQYRQFGRTAKSVSALGFGAMRLPHDEDEAIAIIRRAIDSGVNYLDTARGYGDSERICGLALKDGYRDRAYVSTKVPAAEMPRWRELLEESVRILDIDRIDFLQAVHNLSWDRYRTTFAARGGGLHEVRKARDEGLVGHICVSSHDTPDNVIKLIDTGEFEGITLQYNLIDRRYQDAIAHARGKGIGVVIMGPIGGGRLAAPSEALTAMGPGEVKSSAELALRFVLANPHVTCAISGMTSMREVRENVVTCSRTEPLDERELGAIRKSLGELDALGETFCTGCGYCLPCPADVNIPEVFRYLVLHRVWGQTEAARRRYARLDGKSHWNIGRLVGGRDASACTECGECEPKCPHNVPIIEQLKEAHRELGRADPP
jgi:predicted aldo/keto reductase-like oxidoreductase